MAIFLLVRAVSDRFVEAARKDVDVAFSLFDKGLPPPEWNVNAVRDHARRHEALASAGITLGGDAGEVHDLDRAWDGLQRTLEHLGAGAGDLLLAGTEVGGDEEAGIRALTSDEARSALAVLETIDRAAFERGMREVIRASKEPARQTRNPFTGELVTLRGSDLYGAEGGSEEEVVIGFADAFDRLRQIVKLATERGLGLAVQIVL